MVMKEIRKQGYYFHCPSRWEINDEELFPLRDSGILQSFSDAGIEYTNSDYFFVEKGNPQEVVIVNLGNGWTGPRVSRTEKLGNPE